MLFLRYGKITEKGRCNQQLPYREWKSVGSLPSCGQTFRSHKIPCVVFGVSSEVLLEIDMEKSREESENYLTEANALGNGGKGAERTALLREANKNSPRVL